MRFRERTHAEIAASVVPREKLGGKYVCGSHFPPAEECFAGYSCCVNAFKKCSQLGRRPELRNGFQFLEGQGERVRQAPHSPRRELLMLGIEVASMHDAGQVPGYFKFSLNEGSIDDELRGFIRKLAYAPGFNLPAHRFKVPLHAVDADGKAVLQREVLAVFR